MCWVYYPPNLWTYAILFGFKLSLSGDHHGIPNHLSSQFVFFLHPAQVPWENAFRCELHAVRICFSRRLCSDLTPTQQEVAMNVIHVLYSARLSISVLFRMGKCVFAQNMENQSERTLSSEKVGPWLHNQAMQRYRDIGESTIIEIFPSTCWPVLKGWFVLWSSPTHR